VLEPFKLGSTYQCAEGLNNQGPTQLITMYGTQEAKHTLSNDATNQKNITFKL